MRTWVLGTLCVLLPGVVFAQVGNPGDTINNPHPAMPWSGITNPNRVNYGEVVGHIQVPPQQFVIEVLVPTPEGLPRQTQRQVVQVPGYFISETTTGFYYPERWTIDQLNVGVYQWRKLPAEFRRK